LTRGEPPHRPSPDGSNRRRIWSRGQSLVEFAIFIPVLVTILLLAVDVGRVYLGWVTLSNVARIGANFAAQNPEAWQGGGNTTVQTRYRTLMTKDATGIDCSLPATLPAPSFIDSPQYSLGSRVQVNLTCSFSLVTPFLSNLIGDGAGHVNVTTAAIFAIRNGSTSGVVINGNVPTATPTAAPTAAPTATSTVAPTATPVPTATVPGSTPEPTPTATITPEPRVISFYGSSTSTDASGGGPPGSVNENQILGVPTLAVTFTDTSTGPPKTVCLWDFGDGNTVSSCGNQVSHSYTTRGTFNVTLTIDGTSLTRTSYVLVSCKVPAFAGVHVNSASTTWTNAGFSSANLNILDPNGNYKIGYQSLAGGLVNPFGGCSGATITVGK
jgi:PKD repeat protein